MIRDWKCRLFGHDLRVEMVPLPPRRLDLSYIDISVEPPKFVAKEDHVPQAGSRWFCARCGKETTP